MTVQSNPISCFLWGLITRGPPFTDLAVIFWPGLISHPSPGLSPSEHRLSQELLEFLIAYQDWFMLGTPPAPALPPTPLRSLTPPLTATVNVSVSDDERPNPGASSTATLAPQRNAGGMVQARARRRRLRAEAREIRMGRRYPCPLPRARCWARRAFSVAER